MSKGEPEVTGSGADDEEYLEFDEMTIPTKVPTYFCFFVVGIHDAQQYTARRSHYTVVRTSALSFRLAQGGQSSSATAVIYR